MYFLVARLLLSVSLSLQIFVSFVFARREGEEKSVIFFFGYWIFLFCYFVSERRIFFFYTYRLLIDEVENNVKILKLISELSERYKISDGKFPMGSNLIKWATFRRISFIRRM